MKKNWRRTAFHVVGLVAMVGIALTLALNAMIDPERLKAQARAKAKAELGRDLAILDISLRLLPLPMIHAEDVALTDAAAAAEFPKVTAERVSARLALLPLLIGKAEPSSWEIANARIQYRPKAGAAGEGAVGGPGDRGKARGRHARRGGSRLGQHAARDRGGAAAGSGRAAQRLHRHAQVVLAAGRARLPRHRAPRHGACAGPRGRARVEIGRASCRERV